MRLPCFAQRQFVLTLFSLLCFVTVSGQQLSIDSIRHVIRTAQNDTTKVGLLYQCGDLFQNANPDSAMAYYDKARALSAKISFVKGQASYASYAVVILNNQGRFKDALELCQEALRLFEKEGSKLDMATAYLNVGSEWHYLSDFQLATENYLKSLKLAEEINDTRLQRIANNNLASIFIDTKSFVKGKAYAEKSLAIAVTMKNEYAISSSTINIAAAEVALKQYEMALTHYSEIEKIGEHLDDYTVLLDAWLGKAEVYSALTNWLKAEIFFKKVITLAKDKNAPEYEMYADMGMIDLCVATDRIQKGEEYAHNGQSLATSLGSDNELKDIYLKVADLKEKSRDYAGALDYRKKFEVLNDTILGEKSKNHISLLEIRFQSEKKESMIRQLELDKEIQQLTIDRKNNINYVFIGLSIATLFISILFYLNYKQKQELQLKRINELEVEKKLMTVEAVLKGEEQERTRLAKDLHDGLGGMLSGIKYSFSSMKGHLIMTPENHEVFERSITMIDNSIKEMRRVAHNMMPEALVKFGLDAALQNLCDDCNQSGVLKVRYQSVGMTNAANQTTSITLYRIIQELINNVIKHADATDVIIQLVGSGNQISVTVEDNGKGFDTSALDKSRGIGWTNIKHRIEFLKGTLDVDSKPGVGTSVYIELINQ